MANSSLFDEYDALMGAESGGTESIAAPSEPSLFVEGLKQFGSGAVEGSLGLLGLGVDALGNAILGPPSEPTLETLMPASTLASKISQSVTAKPVESGPLKWVRTGGEFIGPSAVLGAAKKLFGLATKAPSIIRTLTSDVAGATGAEVGEYFGGDVGRLFGGGAGQMVIPLGKNVGGAVRDVATGPATKQVEGTAGKILRENTGLTPEALTEATSKRKELAARLPADKFRTTAELTKDPNLAQIELVSTMEGQPHAAYTQRKALREEARNATIDKMSRTKAVNPEKLGSDLMDAANKNMEGQRDVASKYWTKHVEDVVVDITDDTKELKGILPKSSRGSPLNADTLKLVDDFSAPSGKLTTEELQQIRSKALEKNRAGTELTSYDKKVRSWIADKARFYLEADPNWAKGTEKTASMYKVFKTGKSPTVGGILVGKNTRASNALQKVFKGDAQSAKELKSAIGNAPQVLEDYKRGVLDTLKRDSSGSLTLDKTQKFFRANKNHLTEILGPEHSRNFQRVVNNLASEGSVQRLATTSTGKQSMTGQVSAINSAMDVIVKGAGNPFLWRISPTAAYLSRILGGLSEKSGKAGVTKLKEVLAAAAMEPEYAKMLLEAPSKQGIITIVDRLAEIASAGVYGGAKGAVRQPEGPDVFDEFDSLMQGVPESIPAAKASNPKTKEEDPMILLNQFFGEPEVKKKTETVTTKTTSKKAELEALAEKIALDTGVDPTMFKSLAIQESGWNPKAKSDKGALGLAQLMPATARGIAQKLGLKSYDLKDPETNLLFGATYLKEQMDKYEDAELALTAYHSGPSTVDKLLKATKGDTLDDIMKGLGPVGKQYARSILGRITKENA